MISRSELVKDWARDLTTLWMRVVVQQGVA